jgi:hypothetical protein
VNESVIMNSIVANNKTKQTSGTEPAFIPFVIPIYLLSLTVHPIICVENYAVACSRVLSSAPLQIIDDCIFVRFSGLDSCLVQKLTFPLLRSN